MNGRRYHMFLTRRLWMLVGAVLVILAIVVGCGSEDELATGATDAVAEAPAGFSFSSPTWLPSLDGIVVSLQPVGHGLTEEAVVRRSKLAVVDLKTGTVRPLRLEDDHECEVTERVFPLALFDGRLAFLQRCIDPTRSPTDGDRLMAWNPKSSLIAQLLRHRLHAARDFAFSEDLSVGVAPLSTESLTSIVLIKGEALSPLELPMHDVSYVAISSSGSSIAATATSAAEFDRTDAPRESLMIIDVQTKVKRVVLDEIIVHGAPQWSPDGDRIALSITPDDGETGVWIVDVATGHSTLVRKGRNYRDITWLPGGNEIVAVVGERDGEPSTLELLKP